MQAYARTTFGRAAPRCTSRRCGTAFDEKNEPRKETTTIKTSDTRFVNVGLVYGAGDVDRVFAASLKLRPRWTRPAVAWLATRPFARFFPERYVARISPRPVVMVNGEDDPQMPRRAVETLYDAAREPKTIVWLRTGHLKPEDTALVSKLVETTLDCLPAFKDVAATRR